MGGVITSGARLGVMDMTSSWASANQVVLEEVNTDEKSNEITAMLRLLQRG